MDLITLSVSRYLFISALLYFFFFAKSPSSNAVYPFSILTTYCRKDFFTFGPVEN